MIPSGTYSPNSSGIAPVIIIKNIGKSNNIKVFGSNKTKGPKQVSQNQLRSPILEGGEP